MLDAAPTIMTPAACRCSCNNVCNTTLHYARPLLGAAASGPMNTTHLLRRMTLSRRLCCVKLDKAADLTASPHDLQLLVALYAQRVAAEMAWTPGKWAAARQHTAANTPSACRLLPSRVHLSLAQEALPMHACFTAQLLKTEACLCAVAQACHGHHPR